MRKILLTAIIISYAIVLNAQVQLKITCPDTVFTNQKFLILNQSTGTTKCLWKIGSDSISLDTVLTQNIGILDPNPIRGCPIRLSLAQDGNKYYLFYTGYAPATNIIRITFNGSYLDPSPVVDSIPGSVANPTKGSLFGITIKYDSALKKWFGFYIANRVGCRPPLPPVGCGYSLLGDLMRINFGTSPESNPSVSDVHCIDSALGHILFGWGIDVVKDDDANKWYAFVGFETNFEYGTKPWAFARYEFDDTLSATPVYTKITETMLGAAPATIGSLMYTPNSIRSVKDENGNWYSLVLNRAGSQSFFTRINWGSSLSSNTPTAVKLPQFTNVTVPYDFQLIDDNGKFYAGIVSGNAANGFSLANFYKINEVPTAINYGPLTNASNGISDFYRMTDTLVAFAGHSNGSLTRIVLKLCANEVLPSSTECNPDSISFSKAGTYVIRLYADGKGITKTVIVKDNTASQKNEATKCVRIYPTYAEKALTLETDNSSSLHYEIIDGAGVAVVTNRVAMSPISTIDVSALVPGIHFIRITDGSCSQVSAFVKQ